MKYFGIIGKPVGHSKSPAIMNAAFTSANINAKYFYIVASNIDSSIQLIKHFGFKGINVTAPYKEKILNFTNNNSDEAIITGSVNVVTFDNDKSSGYNTDYIGIIESLKKHKLIKSNYNYLIIGAGGAAKSAVYALKDKFSNVGIINRTLQKSIDVANQLNTGLQIHSWDEINNVVKNYDVIINTIPADSDILQKIEFQIHQAVLDANYTGNFLKKNCQNTGAKYFGGKTWLLNQAYPVFEIFTGIKPPKNVMQHAIKSDNSWKKIVIVNITNQKFKNIFKSLNQYIIYFDNSDEYNVTEYSNFLKIALCDKSSENNTDLSNFNMLVWCENLTNEQIIELINNETGFTLIS
ncbi:MAG: hypothetical protein Kow0068_03670 [Marinilabiliales bacterium]